MNSVILLDQPVSVIGAPFHPKLRPPICPAMPRVVPGELPGFMENVMRLSDTCLQMKGNGGAKERMRSLDMSGGSMCVWHGSN
jgi:hypothetical protein